jgi:uncharacterized protein (DUF433 family)
MLAEGMTEEETAQALPGLARADIREALRYGTDKHIP